ncbi:SRPBCC family protein [Humidisolicoccus flavus]|uniref:SRPBCC family protein n=1 Tax=Humidisolicoccus flavus TaxID=3111414 RepID=UPI00324740C0
MSTDDLNSDPADWDPQQDSELEVVASVAAPIDQVFAAWSTEMMPQWWWPMWDDVHYDFEPVPGRGWRIRTIEGGIGVHGEFIEVEDGEQLDFTWIWEGGHADGSLRQESVTVKFSEFEDDTIVRVTQSASDDEIDSLTDGWQDCLTRLEELFD